MSLLDHEISGLEKKNKFIHFKILYRISTCDFGHSEQVVFNMHIHDLIMGVAQLKTQSL